MMIGIIFLLPKGPPEVLYLIVLGLQWVTPVLTLTTLVDGSITVLHENI